MVEQPIRLQHNLTQRLVNESVHFLEEHAHNSSPFLLVISWVQVHCIFSLLHARFAGADPGFGQGGGPRC